MLFRIPIHFSDLSCMYLQLPLSIYESLIEIVDAKPKILFTGLPYTLATEDAERIGVDHIARSSVTGATERSAG